MVQVRCPECGYLQTLSEDRFLSISEDFLNCPHCHAKVPKQWNPEAGESVPEEVRHKMLAFSRRILNGGDVGREVVVALEALVRRYGAGTESRKALGIGYANVGETKKAEEFLVQACRDNPDDPEILHSLLEIFLAHDKFGEAVEVGNTLLSITGSGAAGKDVAGLALALTGLDRMDDAEALLLSYPQLDSHDPLVKKVKRALNRGTHLGLGGVFGEEGLLHRILRRGWKTSLKGSQRLPEGVQIEVSRAPRTGTRPAATRKPNSTAERRTGASDKWERVRSVFEFWVYAPVASIPRWEEVKTKLTMQIDRKFDRARTLGFLESLIEHNDLTVDYIVKGDASDLFDYPEDLIPANSRDLSLEDRNTLMNAQMIVRLRLSVAEAASFEALMLIIRLVEAVRILTGGVVQDAVSHALWGTEPWHNYVENPGQRLVESNIQVEILDEGGTVWIHTHGMQKFGLPDLEMEGVPHELAGAGRNLMIVLAERLVTTREWKAQGEIHLTVPDAPFVFRCTERPRDAEGHFPAGSLLICPVVSGGESAHAVTMAEVLGGLRSGPRKAQESGLEADSPGLTMKADERTREEIDARREQMLTAHRKAKEDLHLFKKSFQQSGESAELIHAVKVGFPAHDGQYEWMWVTLNAWRGNALVGNLENTPVLRKDLGRGTRVQISEGQIFDWVIAREGKVLRGPYTEQIQV